MNDIVTYILGEAEYTELAPDVLIRLYVFIFLVFLACTILNMMLSGMKKV